MSYNFDEIIPRRGTNALKWDACADEEIIPMWIADMDFRTAPEVIQALAQRVNHGIFGYAQIPPEFFIAIQHWWKKRHQLGIDQDWIIPITGIIPALSVVLRTLTASGDKTLVLSPVYNHFYHAIANSESEVIESPLIYKNGKYSIDFEDLESKASDPSVKLMLFCNPHNPTGRCWTSAELKKVAEISSRHGLTVISDEIHADLVAATHRHTPFASIADADTSITLASPSKSFNLAGLQVGYLITSNADLKKRIEQTIEIQDTSMLSPFAITALIAAYTQGEQWLDALRDYLHQNYLYLEQYFLEHFPGITVTPLEATYLVWIDCRPIAMSSVSLTEQILENEKVWLNPGSMYGSGGEGFLRINIACPRPLLVEALTRLRTNQHLVGLRSS